MSRMVFVSSLKGGIKGRKKASNFNCTFFPVCLLSARLAVAGAEVGRGGVYKQRKDIHATRAHPRNHTSKHSTALICDGKVVSTTL